MGKKRGKGAAVLDPRIIGPEEVEERNKAFNEFVANHGDKLGYFLLPANKQAQVRGLMQAAFNAGYRTHRNTTLPIITGGYD